MSQHQAQSEHELHSKKNKSGKRVFSGTRASGRLHLGNYLGAVKGYIELQNKPEYDCIYMVMDLHTITTPYDAQTLPTASRDIILDYLAAGLDPDKAIITAQSLVAQHTYLNFLFSSVMTAARMQHLPTFKEKAKQHPQNITMALLNYPILMAADILLYHAQLVPVGIDQEPHLEVARKIARKMNQKYDTDFPEPQRFSTAGEYVPSLTGEGKMSKSVPGSYISLSDDLDTIQQKLAAAPTDSGRGKIKQADQTAAAQTSVKADAYLDKKTNQESKGVASLLRLVQLFEGDDKMQYYQDLYQGKGIQYAQLKQELAQAIYADLNPIQQKRQELTEQPDYINDIIRAGASQAQKIAQQTLTEVKAKMGFDLFNG